MNIYEEVKSLAQVVASDVQSDTLCYNAGVDLEKKGHHECAMKLRLHSAGLAVRVTLCWEDEDAKSS